MTIQKLASIGAIQREIFKKGAVIEFVKDNGDLIRIFVEGDSIAVFKIANGSIDEQIVVSPIEQNKILIK